MSETVTSYYSVMILTELEDAAGRDNVKTRHSDRLAHAVDYYWVPRCWVDRGREPILPDYVVYPESTAQVSKILRIANQHRIPVTVWGGGAGSQGGALPIRGGVVLDMKKMNRIVEINDAAATVTVETGIIHQHLEWELNKRKLSTMHLPASIGCSTLGGFLAHRGTGVLSTKYGKIEDLIISMEVVLPDGEVITTLPVPRNASGPDLNQLFIGSEGTYGVITRATVKIFEEPECRKYRAFIFRNMHDALEAGRQIMTRRLQPCVIRMYDEAETKHQIKRVLGIEKDGAYPCSASTATRRSWISRCGSQRRSAGAPRSRTSAARWVRTGGRTSTSSTSRPTSWTSPRRLAPWTRSPPTTRSRRSTNG